VLRTTIGKSTEISTKLASQTASKQTPTSMTRERN
jgi:hypothetical protein